MVKKDFRFWRGIPREEIDWHPSIDEQKCVGCGLCVTGCGREVYGFDYEKKKPVVVRPNNCMVGCVTCANICLEDAIRFPSVEYVREIVKKKKLRAKAMEQLMERKGELAAAG